MRAVGVEVVRSVGILDVRGKELWLATVNLKVKVMQQAPFF
jgi:hypothetical protein